MASVRSRYPCWRCLRHERCRGLLDELQKALDEAQLCGMAPSELPEVYVDCEGRYSPASLLHRGGDPLGAA